MIRHKLMYKDGCFGVLRANRGAWEVAQLSFPPDDPHYALLYLRMHGAILPARVDA